MGLDGAIVAVMCHPGVLCFRRVVLSSGPTALFTREEKGMTVKLLTMLGIALLT